MEFKRINTFTLYKKNCRYVKHHFGVKKIFLPDQIVQGILEAFYLHLGIEQGLLVGEKVVLNFLCCAGVGLDDPVFLELPACYDIKLNFIKLKTLSSLIKYCH